jgi:hypothetical protein
MEKISRGCLTPGRTRRLTVVRNMTLILTLQLILESTVQFSERVAEKRDSR